MRGIGIAVLALLAAVACGSAGATPSGDEARKRPALSIVSVDPLTVKGKRFVAHERVKLLVGSPAPRMKAARADARGRFTVRFEIGADRLAGVVVQAIGSRGSRALIDVTAPGRAPLGSPPGGYHPPGERP
jgi:hypothetical protein